jgi:hypothetical protein
VAAWQKEMQKDTQAHLDAAAEQNARAEQLLAAADAMRVETAQIVAKAEVQASLILAAAAEQEALKHRELAARLAKGVCLMTAAVVTGRPDIIGREHSLRVANRNTPHGKKYARAVRQ